MTSKIYRSAQGKSVDLGTIMLQNEHVRAVGNMKVNARGDKLDSANKVIETKSQQIQKQNNRTTTNVSAAPVHTSSKKSRGNAQAQRPNIRTPEPTATPSVEEIVAPPVEEIVAPAPVAEPTPVVAPAPVAATPTQPAPVAATPAPVRQKETRAPAQGGGLAGAIARTREIKQELDRTRRQQAQDKGVRKI